MSPLLKKLQAAKKQPTVDKIPPGHRTREQWSEEWGLCKSRTIVLLKLGVTSGVMKMVRYRVKSLCGACHMPHYYEVKKGGKK